MSPKLTCLPKGVAPPERALLVDDCANPGGAMVIDHHINHTTPQAYCKGRTATERVLHALSEGLSLDDFEAVAIRHYDADGVLAVWSVLNPEIAKANANDLVIAAEFGDFFSGPAHQRRALTLSFAVQEAVARDFAMGGKGWFRKRPTLQDSYEFGLDRVTAMMQGAAPPVSAEGLVRQFEEETHFVPLVRGTVPVFRLAADALVHSVMAAGPEPVIVTASPVGEEGRWGYSLLLRPLYGWGYSEDAVGQIPLSALDGLETALANYEREATGGIARWESRRFDGATWRLDCRKRGSSLKPDQIAAAVAGWLEEHLRTKEGVVT